MSTWLKCAGLASLLLLGWFSATGTLHAQLSPYGLGPPGGLGGAPALYPGAAVNPYLPLGGGVGGFGAGNNLYNPVGGGGYGQSGNQPMIYYSSSGGNGGIYGTAGGALYGAAQVINAYGNALNAQENSRIMREQYYQAKLDTQRKAFDLKRYIAANTPSYAEQTEKLNQLTLRRLRANAAPGEVANGSALNTLLENLGTFAGKRASIGAAELPSDVLGQLNVSKRGSSVGLLRNDGKIENWPVGLADVLTQEQRNNLSLRAQAVVREAARGKQLDPNVYKDLRTAIETTREQLFKRVNDMPGDQYRDAKRFVADLENSLKAVQDGELAAQAEFDNWVGGKARPVQEVVDYLVNKGLRFAPASPRDEAAYRALYAALVNYDVALNVQFNPEPREKE